MEAATACLKSAALVKRVHRRQKHQQQNEIQIPKWETVTSFIPWERIRLDGVSHRGGRSQLPPAPSVPT